MKVSVCSTITYHYDADIPDELCEKDKDGYLVNERDFLEACYEADQTALTNVTEYEGDIISVWTADGKEGLY